MATRTKNDPVEGHREEAQELRALVTAILSTAQLSKGLKEVGFTPLHALADTRPRVGESEGAHEIRQASVRLSVEVLKLNGVNIDSQRAKDGKTALHLAAANGNYELHEALVRAGADVNIMDKQGWSPLAAAAYGTATDWSGSTRRQRGYPQIVKYLLQHKATILGSHALHNAAKVANLDTMRILLNKGSPNQQDGEKNPPTYYCCRKEEGISGEAKVEALSLLHCFGADLNFVVSSTRSTLLHVAASVGDSQVVTCLVEKYGLPVSAKNSEQATPLHLAAQYNRADTVKELVRLGAPCDALDEDDNTPLLWAVSTKSAKAVEGLIAAGGAASVRATRADGTTALHCAAAVGSLRCAYLLVEAGAEVDVLNYWEESPLMVCLSIASCTEDAMLDLQAALCAKRRSDENEESREKVARFLIEIGASVTETVVKIAAENDFAGVIASSFTVQRTAHKRASRALDSVAQHLRGSAYSKAAEEGRVLQVRLVKRASRTKGNKVYTISLPLMELLMSKTHPYEGKEGARGVPAGCGGEQGKVSAGVLHPILELAQGIEAEDEGKGASGGAGAAREIEVLFDEQDFTEEGFEAVMHFVTTGSVKSLLTRGQHGAAGEGGEAVGEAGEKRGTKPLFDEVRARQALQAADFFCIEGGMSEEVEALMALYGFEVIKREAAKVKRPKKRRRSRSM